MSWYKNIVRSGLSPTHEYQEKRAILLSNYISLLLCGCLLLLFVIRRFVFGHISGGMNIQFLVVGTILFVIPILLNRIQLTTLSRMLLCYAPVCFIWYVYILQMRDAPRVEQAAYDGMRIYLLAVSSIPYLLLNERRPALLVLGILPTLLSVVLFDWTLTQFGIGINQKGEISDESALVGIRTFIAYCVMSVSSFIFQAIITYNDKLNKRILSELKLKSDEIKLQNEKLIQSQERLNQINQHLEELVAKKTASIKEQNEKILHYAYSNAHHVRGPVARLLGLIELSKMETNLDYPWFFEKMEYTAKEVDTIIKGISKELNEIDQPNVATNGREEKGLPR